jgi:hypothetical protein
VFRNWGSGIKNVPNAQAMEILLFLNGIAERINLGNKAHTIDSAMFQ